MEAFKKEMADAFGLEMSAHKTEVQKELDAKDAKIAELELQLSKTAEKESVLVTPNVSEVPLNSKGQLLTLLRKNK